VLGASGITVLGGTGIPGQLLVRTPIPDFTSVETLFASLDIFESFGPNSILRADATPNDARYLELWGLNNTGQEGRKNDRDPPVGVVDADIDAAEAWDTTNGARNIVVAIIDTGIAYTHPDLASNIWTNSREIAGNRRDDDANGFVDDVHGYNFAGNHGDPYDDHGHGTHVAGTIGAIGNNSIGVAGISQNVQLMALKFLNQSARGTTFNAVRAINYATMMQNRGVNVRITNNSWGGGPFDQQLRGAIATSGSAGVMFVAAAGNDGDNNDSFPFYPASYDLSNIISVAATDRRDNLATFSNFGNTSVDLAAPGVAILSTIPPNEYAFFDGTSMATPHVSGAAALAWAAFPNASMQAVRQGIFAGVDTLPGLAGIVRTGGRLNIAVTLQEMASEKRVNTYTPGNQGRGYPGPRRMAMDADGYFVIVWDGPGSPTDAPNEVYAQRYDRSGARVGGNFRVNSTRLAQVNQAPASAVAMDRDGDFVVVWEDSVAQSKQVLAQRFARDGSRLGSQFVVATGYSASPFGPDIAMSDDGRFVVTWQAGPVNSPGNVFARLYDENGVAAGDILPVNTTAGFPVIQSKAAMDSDGDFIIVWVMGNPDGTGPDGSGFGIFGRRYDANGRTQGADFQINTTTDSHQLDPVVSMSADGTAVVAWGGSLDGSGGGVFGQRLGTNGEPLGGEFIVNTFTGGAQFQPAIDVNSDGTFIVSWTSEFQDGDHAGVFAQKFSASGAKDGPEFKVNDSIIGWQWLSAVAANATGSFAVSWLFGNPSHPTSPRPWDVYYRFFESSAALSASVKDGEMRFLGERDYTRASSADSADRSLVVGHMTSKTLNVQLADGGNASYSLAPRRPAADTASAKGNDHRLVEIAHPGLSADSTEQSASWSRRSRLGRASLDYFDEFFRRLDENKEKWLVIG
jgi:hypothetical protein